MVVEADKNGKYPFFVTQDDRSHQLVHKTIDIVIDHRISFLYGKRHGSILETNVNLYFSLIMEQAQKFIESTPSNNSKDYTFVNIQLLKSALKYDQNTLEDISKVYENFSSGMGDENILHILTKRDLSENVSNILKSIKKETAYKLLTEADGKSYTPPMIGAVNDNCNSLVVILAFILVDNDKAVISNILHQTDSTGRTLSYLIMNAGVTLIAPQGIVMQLEKDHHMENDDDEEGFRYLQKCLHEYHRSSAKTVQSLLMINEARNISTIKSIFMIALLIVGCFVGPSSLWFGDVFTDYRLGEQSNKETDTNCGEGRDFL